MNIFAYKITFIDSNTGKASEVKGIVFAPDYVEAVKRLQLVYDADNILEINYLGIVDEDPELIEESTFKFYLADL
jgi:hypothetical protein